MWNGTWQAGWLPFCISPKPLTNRLRLAGFCNAQNQSLRLDSASTDEGEKRETSAYTDAIA